MEKRHYGLDLLKTIGIFLVLFYHNWFVGFQVSDLSTITLQDILLYFFRSVMGTCVPIFFFVNGYLVFSKNNCQPFFELRPHVMKIGKMVALVVVWSLLSLAILIPLNHLSYGPTEIIQGILTANIPSINAIWFLQALVVLYLFFPLLKLAYDRQYHIFIFFLAVVFICTFGNVLLNQAEVVLRFALNKPFPPRVGSTNFFGSFNPVRGIYGFSLVYFMLGALCQKYSGKIINRYTRLVAPAAILLSMVALTAYGVIRSVQMQKNFDIVWFGYDTIPVLVCVVAGYILTSSYHAGSFGAKFVKTVGSNTLGIYFLHVPLDDLLRKLLTDVLHVSINSLWLNLIFVCVLLLACLGICLLGKKCPIVKYLFSLS